MEKSYHADTLKKSVIIAANLQKTWNVVSKIVDLKWLDNIKTAKFLSAKTRGIGATRHISFIDGTNVEEIIVGWKPKKYFSYIAISGLPLRGYHATITITAKNKNSVIVCLLYTSDAADDLLCVDLGGRRIIKKSTNQFREITTFLQL